MSTKRQNAPLRIDGRALAFADLAAPPLGENTLVECKGECHCGAIRFVARANARDASCMCNCSYCSRTRFWKAFAEPGSFALLAGEAALGEYTFASGIVRHCFCSRCGVNLFARVNLGESHDIHVMNVACLDETAMRVFASLPVRHEDGRNDDWWNAPSRT